MIGNGRRWRVLDVFTWTCGLVLAALLGATEASAQSAEDRCLAVAQGPGIPFMRPPVLPARFQIVDLNAGEVRITFVGHSTFLIESPKGVRIATDYNDYVRPAVVPEIATMNRAHSTHYTLSPDPSIKHVLPGWNPAGGPALHDVTEQDVRVRNLPTNIRGGEGTDEFGNSIFIFELGGLCIAHLGHLHHTLSPRQIGQIGQMDVVLAPVDGSYTLDTPGMLEVLKGLKAPLVIPMHYFSGFTLNRFLDVARADFEIKMSAEATVVVSRSTMPERPRILVLPGG